MNMKTTEGRSRRFEEIAWALVLIMTGGLWLAPKAMFPEGTWLAGIGLILLGLNAVRRARGLKMNGFGIIAGLIALGAGIGRIIGQELPVVPVILIVLGVGLVIRAAAGKADAAGAIDAR